LFYLVNDVLQNCRRKNAKIYLETFKKYLIEGFNLALNSDDKSLKKNIERIVDVWSSRCVYDKEFVDKLKGIINEQQNQQLKSPEINDINDINKESNEEDKEKLLVQQHQQIIAEFQPKQLCEAINKFQLLQTELNQMKITVEATRIFDINIETIKQYRDKQKCIKFSTEFDTSSSKLEEFLKKLKDEEAERDSLINLLKQSEIFYDAQFKDAKMVHNAYRIFGGKLHAVKRKVDDLLIKKFDSSDVKLDTLDMELSDDNDDDNKQKSFNEQRSNHSNNSSISNNNDPRQKRRKNSDHKSKERHVHHSHHNRLEEKEPIKDEVTLRAEKLLYHNHQSIQLNESNNSTNPFVFLSNFINKSSTGTSNETTTTSKLNNEQQQEKEKGNGGNLTYLVNSLQKYVNNPSSNETTNENNTIIQYNIESNRSQTPTKDESSYHVNYKILILLNNELKH
jgi:hypothetical protein